MNNVIFYIYVLLYVYFFFLTHIYLIVYRYTPESLDFLKFSNATPMSESIQSSIDTMKQYQTDSFRSPCNPSSAKSRFTSDTGLNYIFKK